MSSENTTRHPDPQYLTLGTDPLWSAPAFDASAIRDDGQSMDNNWLMNNGEFYSPAANEHPFSFSTSSPLLGLSDDQFSTDQYDYGDDNALRLDLSAPGHMLPPSSPLLYDDPQFFSPLPHSSPSMRQHLPQIITTDLPSMPSYPRSPQDQSPYQHYPEISTSGQPPLSAANSSPSSLGYPTAPITPVPLPHSHLGLPAVAGGLLSPHSPYNAFYHLNLATSSPTKSPSTIVPLPSPNASPSSANAGPDDSASTSRQAAPIAITVEQVLEIANRYPRAEYIIPQKPYRPNTQSDRRRYVDEVDLERPIMFFTQHPEYCGIPLRDALTSKFSSLVGRDDPMFTQRGPSVSIRVNWPGYAPWSRQIPTRDFRSPPQPITRSKLAKNVAKTIQRFIDDMKDKPLEDEADAGFRVGSGPGMITIDHLELIGLQHVSMGSWQAHLRLRRRP